MRAVAVLALALLCVALTAVSVAAVDKPKRVLNPKLTPRIAHGIKPKKHVHYDVPTGWSKAHLPAAVLAPATAPVASASASAGGMGVASEARDGASVPSGWAMGAAAEARDSAAPVVLKAGAPNTAACAAKKGACGDRAACTAGTIATGLCPGATYCCVPKAAAPATPLPTVTPAPVTVTKAYLLGKFNPATHPDFRAISTPSGTKYTRKDTYAAYQLMNTAAKNELGFELTILSATRNFDDQKAIWERKWTTDPLYKHIAGDANRALGIMSYSSMPSTSQHHWGTSFDLWSLEPKDFKNTDKGRRLDVWFRDNAARFGFCRPFSPKPPRATGYNEEQWHVSYKPVLKQLIAQYKATITYSDITGFSGSNTAQQIGAIENFVYGIDPACLS